jgi:tetratricopeptide (TPR) repeat protein
MKWRDFDNPKEDKARIETRAKENPGDATAQYEMATMHAYLFDFTTALELCEIAMNLEPKNVTYHAFRSFIYTKLEDHGRAIDDLVTVIELGADESDYDVDVALGAQYGMDKEYAVSKMVDLRKEGKDRIADKLEEWLINY